MFRRFVYSLLLLPSLLLAKPDCCPESIRKGGAIRYSFADESIFNTSGTHQFVLQEGLDYWSQVCNEGQEFSTGPLYAHDTGKFSNVRIESVDLGKLDFKVTQQIAKGGIPVYRLALNSNLNTKYKELYEAVKNAMERILLMQKAQFRKG